MTHSLTRYLLVLAFFVGLRAEAADAPIPVKMVVVANFENGADSGDKPGEFQLWVEREHLTETVQVRGATRPVRRNAAGLYGLLLENLVPFLLDSRFDFGKTYWLFTGISGVDPQLASVGSAAWARWVVNGDEMREIDDREIPAGWPYGLFAIGSMKPNTLPTDANSFGSVESPEELGMAYRLNQGFTLWAYELTRNVVIPDTPALKQQRDAWKGFPNAQRPPFVLLGETLGSVRYWHGPGRTQWARDWVKTWTDGQGVLTMTAGEEQAILDVLTLNGAEGRVDSRRVLVLRTASNYSREGDGEPQMVEFAPGGGEAGFEAAYRVGAPVVKALVAGWPKYATAIPQADSSKVGP